MLKINLFIIILLVVIQRTRQYQLNIGGRSNEDFGKPLMGFAQLQTIPDDDDPEKARPIKNIFRQKRKKKAHPTKDEAMIVPLLLMSNSAFSDLGGGVFNFNDINSFKITQSHNDRDRYRKLRYNVKMTEDDYEKYNDYSYLFKKDQRQHNFRKPKLLKEKNYGLRIDLD